MFTWNFQYISKARLAEALSQLRLEEQRGDILIRIHTAIHMEDEAVDLAKFIKNIVPTAQIFGTSTSAVISWGQLLPNRCVVSVTLMDETRVKTVMLPTYDTETDTPIAPEELSRMVKEAAVTEDTKLMLTFLTRKYLDVYSFIEKCNDQFPGVQMIGGVANTSDISLKKFLDTGFVFNENGCSNKSIMVCSLSGKSLESFSSYATGVQILDEEVEITDTFGATILSIDGKDGAGEYLLGVGEDVKERSELTNLFPYVYSDVSDIPIFVRFSDKESLEDIYPKDVPGNKRFYDAHPDLDTASKRETITANHNVTAGKKLKRAFIYDRKIISDNRSLFRRVENFEKAETLFGYSCIARAMIYSSCVKWELSAYANSNISGCITEGEIAFVNGRNSFANCSFVVSVFGEKPARQDFNPYVFYHTDSLAEDNKELIDYLMDIEKKFELNNRDSVASSLKSFIKQCELKLLYAENQDIPNNAALTMDIKLNGYDRVCVISVTGVSGMKSVFSKELVDFTYRSFVSKCSNFAKSRGYKLYSMEDWQLAIAEPSYMVTLSKFVADMEQLQKELFEYSEDSIAIVPIFCVIDGCTEDNLNSLYYSSRVEMVNKNLQFYVCDAFEHQVDEDSIRERYHMLNVIKYAIENDKVIPYYQGIYNNKTNKIDHYESLMRLQDENGKIYYPNSFLDLARSYGLIYDSLSLQMIRKVFDKFKDIEDISVSMNLNIRDIKNKQFMEYIFDRLSSVPHPENFVFEILENEDIDDYNFLVFFVDRIHALGGQISIDDFGSGFSNLQHIVNIHTDYIKIDGSIVRTCCENIESEHLIALIADWKKLTSGRITIVAEFVENESIQEILLKYNIDYSQGYLFSKPAPELMES